MSFRAVLVGHEEGEEPRGLLQIALGATDNEARSNAFTKLHIEGNSLPKRLPVVIQRRYADGWHDHETLWCRDPHRLRFQVLCKTDRSRDPLTLPPGTVVQKVSRRLDSLGAPQTCFEAYVEGVFVPCHTHSLVAVGDKVSMPT